MNMAIFFFVWLGIYAQHSVVGYYHDDYAYAGMTYCYDVGGLYKNRLTFSNLFSFLYQHYMTWGGRVIAFAFSIPVMHFGPTVFWTVQSVIITAIIIISSLYASRLTKKQFFIQHLIIHLSCYMSLKILLIREGLYWATASILYTWPFLLFVIVLLLLQRDHQDILTASCVVLLSFVVSSTSEQYSVLMVSYLASKLLFDRIFQKNCFRKNVLWLTASIAGLFFCVFAPGNFKRAALYPNQALLAPSELLQEIIHGFTWITTNFATFAPWVLFVLAFLALSQYCSEKEYRSKLLPLYSALLAMLCILILPAARYPRVTMPIFLLLPILISPFAVRLLQKIPHHMATASLLIILCVQIINYHNIYNGYLSNYPVLMENDRILSDYTNGEDNIQLKRLPNDLYAAAMPYNPDSDYITIFMKRYYDIPFDVNIYFVEQ